MSSPKLGPPSYSTRTWRCAFGWCACSQLMSRYVCHGQRVAARATVVQQKTSRPVQFDITESTRSALVGCIRLSGLASDDFLFPSRVHASPHF
jgi:hypothetical protein